MGQHVLPRLYGCRRLCGGDLAPRHVNLLIRKTTADDKVVDAHDVMIVVANNFRKKIYVICLHETMGNFGTNVGLTVVFSVRFI